MKIPREIEVALEGAGLPWELVDGKKHTQVRLSGRFVGILPKNGKFVGNDRRATLNIAAQIKRAAKELRG